MGASICSNSRRLMFPEDLINGLESFIDAITKLKEQLLNENPNVINLKREMRETDEKSQKVMSLLDFYNVGEFTMLKSIKQAVLESENAIKALACFAKFQTSVKESYKELELNLNKKEDPMQTETKSENFEESKDKRPENLEELIGIYLANICENETLKYLSNLSENVKELETKLAQLNDIRAAQSSNE